MATVPAIANPTSSLNIAAQAMTRTQLEMARALMVEMKITSPEVFAAAVTAMAINFQTLKLK